MRAAAGSSTHDKYLFRSLVCTRAGHGMPKDTAAMCKQAVSDVGTPVTASLLLSVPFLVAEDLHRGCWVIEVLLLFVCTGSSAGALPPPQT